MAKISTETTWEDSGYDCDHCGGEILLRTDRETGQPDAVCYQCRECGCQWTLSGDVQRVGSLSNCRTAYKDRVDTPPVNWQDLLSRRLWVILALVAGVVLLRFGGGAALRFLLPLLLIGVAAFLLVRYGRTQMWW